jgi:hypothetical protein
MIQKSIANLLITTPEKKNYQKYQKSYRDILNRSRYHEYFSYFLLVVFFHLQYAVPILLVLLGSITTIPSITKQQNDTVVESVELITNQTADGMGKDIEDLLEILVPKIPYIFGILLIILREINITARPAESYDVSAKYNNKFSSFKFRLITEWTSLTAEATNNTQTYGQFLISKNQELADLIDKYVEARSLRTVLSNNDSNTQNPADG